MYNKIYNIYSIAIITIYNKKYHNIIFLYITIYKYNNNIKCITIYKIQYNSYITIYNIIEVSQYTQVKCITKYTTYILIRMQNTSTTKHKKNGCAIDSCVNSEKGRHRKKTSQ